jgi:hypothetical protein
LPASPLADPSLGAVDSRYVYPETQYQSQNGMYYQQKQVRRPNSSKPEVQQVLAQDVAQQSPHHQQAGRQYTSPPRPSSLYSDQQNPTQDAVQQHSFLHAHYPTLVYHQKPPHEELLMSEVNINALKHFNAQFDRLAALIEKSRLDLRDVTVQEKQDAAADTDLLETNTEATQR